MEALPYIREFSGNVVVIKYGGNALAASSDRLGDDMDDAPDIGTLATFAQDIVLLRSVGMLPVVVHGGGPQIGEMMRRLGKAVEFRDGLRVTDAETLDIARMVLVGKVNREIVSAINVHAPLAVGLSGEDAHLITAEQRSAQLGFVGDILRVDPTMVRSLLVPGPHPGRRDRRDRRRRPGLQHQRRHRRRGHRSGARGRQARVPDRRAWGSGGPP